MCRHESLTQFLSSVREDQAARLQRYGSNVTCSAAPFQQARFRHTLRTTLRLLLKTTGSGLHSCAGWSLLFWFDRTKQLCGTSQVGGRSVREALSNSAIPYEIVSQ